MGKLLFCSEGSDFEKINSLVTGFSVSSSGKGEFGQYSTYQKLRLPTKNRYQSGNDFAIGVGTFIYNGKKDADALKDILQNWNDDIGIRRSIIGSYCIGIYKSGVFSLFVDESATYKLYFYLDPDTHRFAATTTLYHLAKGMHCAVDDIAFLADIFLCNIDGKTMCPDIRWLTGEQMLHCEKDQWVLCEISSTQNRLTGDFCQYILEKYKDLPTVFSQSGTFLTGGQDSRITLSLMLALGMKPSCYYGIGDSTITNTKSEDLQCVQKLAAQNDLPVCLMDWADSEMDGLADYLGKYGEMYSIYGMSKNFFHEFEESMQGEFFTLGYLGETFRDVETIVDYPHENYTLSQYIDEMFLPGWKPMISKSFFPALREFIYKQHLIYCQTHEIDPARLTKDSFQELNSVYRLRWDMMMNQFINMFFYSFPLFGDKDALDYVNHVPYQHKFNSKFQMECIDKFYPTLLDIPFFSHIKPKIYHPQTHELTEKQGVVSAKDKVKRFVKNPVLYRMCRYMYYILRGDKKGLKEIRQLYLVSQDSEKMIAGETIRPLLCEDLSSIEIRTAVRIYLYEQMRKSISK